LEGENFGEFGEFYSIRQNFIVQLKIDFKKLSYREYSPIYRIRTNIGGYNIW